MHRSTILGWNFARAIVLGVALLVLVPLPALSAPPTLADRTSSVINEGSHRLAGGIPAGSGFWNPVYPTDGPPCGNCDEPDTLVFDPIGGYDILLGCTLTNQVELWQDGGGTWRSMAVGSNPAPGGCTGAPPAVFDTAENELIVVTWNGSTSQTWGYSDGSWVSLASDWPPHSCLSGDLAYDPVGNEVLWFGGCYCYSDPVTRFSRCGATNYTMVFANQKWTNLTAQLTRSPPPDGCPGYLGDVAYPSSPHCSVMSYEPSAGAVVLAGVGPDGAQTWQFRDDQWSNLTPTSGNGPAQGVFYFQQTPSFACSTTSSFCLLQSEYTPPSGGAPVRGDNDSWALENGTWVELPLLLEPRYDGFDDSGPMTYDASAGDFLMIMGGSTTTEHGPSPQQWILQFGGLPAGPTIKAVGVSPILPVLGDRVVLSVMAENGVGQPVFSYSGLPPGCVAQNTSRIACTPSASGSFLVSITATDFLGRSGEYTFTLTIWSTVDLVALAVAGIVAAAGAFFVVRSRIRKRRRARHRGGDPVENSGPSAAPSSSEASARR